MGAFATVAGLVSAALLWGMPNALITAERPSEGLSGGGGARLAAPSGPDWGVAGTRPT